MSNYCDVETKKVPALTSQKLLLEVKGVERLHDLVVVSLNALRLNFLKGLVGGHDELLVGGG